MDGCRFNKWLKERSRIGKPIKENKQIKEIWAMIKIIIYRYLNDVFVVNLRITDGIEPILVTKDFGEVEEKIEKLWDAIPQTIDNWEIKTIEINY